MNLICSKLVKIILCCVMGMLFFTGCTSTNTPTDPVVVEPSEPVDERSQIEILAEEYDHLQWYLDDSTSKTVDGVAYDLTSLKQQYGDLYRFVEPLTKEDIEYRFQYFAEFFAVQVQDGDFEMYCGGLTRLPSLTSDEYLKYKSSFYEKMANTTDEKLKKYSSYYYYLEKTKKYYKDESQILVDLNSKSELINIIDQISFDDKEWFVRSYMAEAELILKLLEKNKANCNIKSSTF